MRFSCGWILFLISSCAATDPRPSPRPEPSPAVRTPVVEPALAAPEDAPGQLEAAELESLHADACTEPPASIPPSETPPDAIEEVAPGDADETVEDGLEEEEHPSAAALSPELRYTADLTDEELARRWKDELESLDSISVGFAHDGRLINGVQFPAGDGRAWVVISPQTTWATRETVEYLTLAATRVKSSHPDAFPLRVNEASAKDGGHLRPHRSHQNGRDVDLGFYYPSDPPPRVGARERVIAVDQNWSLVRALVTLTDVQVILVDRRVQEVLYDYALSIGEDRAWLDALFRSGPNSIIQHAPRHRDHFHVRFYNPRAQELGRRVAPLLAQRPEHNLVSVRVRYGDTLSGIAVKYGSSIRAIQKANRMSGTFLRATQRLKVPLFGPCNRCPVPPPVEVPPRTLPPDPASPPITMLLDARDARGHDLVPREAHHSAEWLR